MPSETPTRPINPLWLVLGLAIIVLLPFGPMPLLVGGLAGMFLGQQLALVPGVLAVVLLFLLAGPEPVGARLWPAFRWGAGTVLAATVPAAVVALAWSDWLEAQRFALLELALWIDAAWLLPAALLAWWRPAGARWPKALLVACALTSRLMMFPLLLAGVVTSSEMNGMQVIVAPIFAAGICLGMLMLLGLCGAVAWGLQAAGRWLPPRRILAVLALAALAAQLARLALGLPAGL
ncbi:hypothetical protein [Roseomonas sp. 18066]|uniref:hypothetical protein n=1 Tax=Roseomonas sp. 18066 TaxID=2681412 RepID=UPI0013573A79|nr:hypothetical protein [Roseomonas sp. 18066]